MVSELQIRGGIEDNSDMFSYFPTKTYVVTPHWNRLNEIAHNIRFKVIWKIVLKLSLLVLLIRSIRYSSKGVCNESDRCFSEQ